MISQVSTILVLTINFTSSVKSTLKSQSSTSQQDTKLLLTKCVVNTTSISSNIITHVTELSCKRTTTNANTTNLCFSKVNSTIGVYSTLKAVNLLVKH